MDSKVRIEGRVRKETGGCWTWAGPLNRGYGRLRFQGRQVYAHRLAYELWVGPISSGVDLDHLCRNRACCNPAHLEPVTRAENAKRGLAGYSVRFLCRAGLHDITKPENIYVRPDNGQRECLICKRAKNLEARRRYLARKAER